jgi:hypothetical protein
LITYFKVVVADGSFHIKGAVDGITEQQVPECFRLTQIADGGKLKVGIVIAEAKQIATNAAEPHETDS